MTTLSPGKARRIQTLADERGKFKILAVDHRDSMKAMIDADDPEGVSASTLTDIKLAVLRGVGNLASGVLLDPVYGAAQSIAAGVLPGSIGFLSAIEEQGYLGDPHARQTTLLNGWGVEKAARLGASGIKMLIFYHPDAGAAAVRQEQLVESVVADCGRFDIPLFLEPIGYPVNPSLDARSAEYASGRRQMTVETARRLGALGPDVLKLPFPVDVRHEPSHDAWRAACSELDSACPVPWALLSAGDPYESFKAQLEIACEAGCSGFLAGRAVWREVIDASPSERDRVVEEVVLPRFRGLCQVVDEHAVPWTRRLAAQSVDETFFRRY